LEAVLGAKNHQYLAVTKRSKKYCLVDKKLCVKIARELNRSLSERITGTPGNCF